LKRGKGLMFSTAHFGNWELMAAYCGLRGYPLAVVARRQKMDVFERYISWVRARSGNVVVEKKKSMRKLMRMLKDNGILGILMDHNVTRSEGVFVDFLGTPASTNKGPALLAVKMEVPVVPAFIVREGRGHKIVIGDEVHLVSTGDKDSDIVENTRRIIGPINDIIRRYPEQWFWVHRRWRTRPLDEVERKE
ncbi:MAG: lysophospholipid acyltransferase family protein, partial [Thermodesulfobacteriota bacterium]